jgi:hypothetical protein
MEYVATLLQGPTRPTITFGYWYKEGEGAMVCRLQTFNIAARIKLRILILELFTEIEARLKELTARDSDGNFINIMAFLPDNIMLLNSTNNSLRWEVREMAAMRSMAAEAELVLRVEACIYKQSTSDYSRIDRQMHNLIMGFLSQ